MTRYVISFKDFISCRQLKRWRRRHETDNVTETGDETYDETDNGDETGDETVMKLVMVMNW
jgi:hypothetical protein